MTDQLNDNMQALDLTTKPTEDPAIPASTVTAAAEAAEDFVDPWNVTSSSEKGIDYEKLISKSYWKFCKAILVFTLLFVNREVWQFQDRFSSH